MGEIKRKPKIGHTKDRGLDGKAKRSQTLDRIAAEIGHQRRVNEVLGTSNARLVVPSVVAMRGATKRQTPQAQTSEPVVVSIEENTMANNVAPGLHKDHKPAIADKFYDYKKIHSVELIQPGLAIARRGESKDGGIVFSLSIVRGVVKNPGLDGGGVAKLETIWHSDPNLGRYRRTSASFKSLKDNHNSYRLYPFNVEQPLPEPEPEKRPEVVVAPPMFDLADPTNLTVSPELQGVVQRIADRVQLTPEQWAEAMALEQARFRLEKKDREEFYARKGEEDARQKKWEESIDFHRDQTTRALALSEENNRLLTLILATLRELKDKW